MRIKVDPSALLRTKWHEYATRFFIGGAITVATGLIAERFGPSIGGLFLAFPAIFPASATLIEKHECRKKERAGLHGSRRGRRAVALDAFGATLGGFAMVAFALFVWRGLSAHATWLVLTLGVLAWFAISAATWKTDDSLRRAIRRTASNRSSHIDSFERRPHPRK